MQRRGMTRGNASAQLSRLRENISSINPIIAATLRNATPRNGRTPEADELTAGKDRNQIQPHKLERISNIIANNINAATDLRSITPYIDRAELIWSSLLLYPNGKQKTILSYSTRPSRSKNTVLHTSLLKLWSDYFINDYKIEDELREQIDDMLWNTGSYVTLTMSRLSLDYLINGMELVNRNGKEGLTPSSVYQATQGNYIYDPKQQRMRVMNVGNYVAPPNGGTENVLNVNGLEGLFAGVKTSSQPEFDILEGSKLAGTGFSITLTDNPALLAQNLLASKRKEFNEKYYSGAEDFSSIIKSTLSNAGAAQTGHGAIDPKQARREGDELKKHKKPVAPKAVTTNLTVDQLNQVQHELFPARRAPYQFMQFLKQDTDLPIENYGTPIDFHIPSAAIIPVHIGGRFKKKKDYIILIDPDTGEWLNPAVDHQFYQSAKKGDGPTSKNVQGSTNALIDNLKQIQQGKDCDFDMSEFIELSKTVVVEQFLKSVLSGRSGVISIDLDEETNKIFLARMFKGQGVRCLYVPGENITYAAFKYNNFGVGQSLTQQAKMHIARLAAFDLADAMATMEAAQSTNKMRIAIDKDDPTPEQTIAMAREVFFRANPRFYNVLATSQMSIPVLVDAFKELSLTLEVDASENPYMPTPQVTVEPMEKQNFRRIDPSSREELLNKIASYIMLPKGWLDVATDSNNFQIEALTEHRLVYNQAINWQEQLAEFIMEREVKHVRLNKPLLVSMIQVINENKKLWKSDNKEEVLGATDQDKIEAILEDFLNTVECSLPTPAAMENAKKITESLGAVKDYVDQQMIANSKSPMIKQAIKDLNLEGQFGESLEDGNNNNIEDMIRAYLYRYAHKLFNIPSPFEDAVDDPSGGGIASIVGDVATQNATAYRFVAELVIETLKTRTDLSKEHKKKIEDALAKFQTVKGESETDPDAPPPLPGEEQPADFSGGIEPAADGTEETSEEPVEEGTEPTEEGGEESEESEENEESEESEENADTDAVDKNTLSDNPEGDSQPF